jgi:putative transposase
VTVDVRQLAREVNAPLAAVCRALSLPRSTVYARENAQLSARAVDDVALDAEVRRVFENSSGRYGSPRVHRELRRSGRRVARKRVARRMRQMGLAARRRKRFRRTTQADPRHQSAPNVLDRRFIWPLPNQAWAGDITYIWTATGWVYLALLLDLYTRKVAGWAVGDHCDTELALVALRNAYARERPGPGLLHHTDRGSTYTAGDYQDELKRMRMVVSMSRKGNCWDNAVAESTIGTIKTEALSDGTPADIHEVRRILFRYIEGFYNNQRLHSTLGYVSPVERERTLAKAAQAA